MTLLGWRWAIARPYRSSVLMHGCSRLQAVHSASMVATPLPCVPTWKFEVYDLPDQDVLDKGYMDTDDAVYLTFHSLEQGGRCNSLTSLALSFIFHLTVADSACLAGELVGDINGGQPLPALFLKADLPPTPQTRLRAVPHGPFGFCHYTWALHTIEHSAKLPILETNCIPPRMMFGTVIAWPDVDFSRADWPSRNEPVNFLCNDFHVKGEICCLVSDPDLSPHDAPRVDQETTNHAQFPVVYVAESKFVSLWQSKVECDAVGYLDFLGAACVWHFSDDFLYKLFCKVWFILFLRFPFVRKSEHIFTDGAWQVLITFL